MRSRDVAHSPGRMQVHSVNTQTCKKELFMRKHLQQSSPGSQRQLLGKQVALAFQATTAC